MRMLAAVTVAVALGLTGCATETASRAQGTAYSGEVWNWDENESTVTLRQGAETIRLKVTPDQIRGLRLHQWATVRGEPAPPMEITRYITPAVPVRPVPRGPVDESAVTGVVQAADPRGRLSIQSDRGPLQIWAAPAADQRFKPGDKVRVSIAVQPVDMVPIAAGESARPNESASPSTPDGKPGDYAVVTGRIMGVAANGTLVVESPTGPVQVWVAESMKYKVEQPVQIQTHVATTP